MLTGLERQWQLRLVSDDRTVQVHVVHMVMLRDAQAQRRLGIRRDRELDRQHQVQRRTGHADGRCHLVVAVQRQNNVPN